MYVCKRNLLLGKSLFLIGHLLMMMIPPPPPKEEETTSRIKQSVNSMEHKHRDGHGRRDDDESPALPVSPESGREGWRRGTFSPFLVKAPVGHHNLLAFCFPVYTRTIVHSLTTGARGRVPTARPMITIACFAQMRTRFKPPSSQHSSITSGIISSGSISSKQLSTNR